MVTTSASFENVRAVPGVAVALAATATLGGLTLHSVIVAATEGSGREHLALAIGYGVLLLSWVFCLVQRLQCPRSILILASISALAALVGAIVHQGTTAGAYYWIAVLALGLVGLTQQVVRS